jgi:hypothetical protein
VQPITIVWQLLAMQVLMTHGLACPGQSPAVVQQPETPALAAKTQRLAVQATVWHELGAAQFATVLQQPLAPVET